MCSIQFLYEQKAIIDRYEKIILVSAFYWLRWLILIFKFLSILKNISTFVCASIIFLSHVNANNHYINGLKNYFQRQWCFSRQKIITNFLDMSVCNSNTATKMILYLYYKWLLFLTSLMEDSSFFCKRVVSNAYTFKTESVLFSYILLRRHLVHVWKLSISKLCCFLFFYTTTVGKVGISYPRMMFTNLFTFWLIAASGSSAISVGVIYHASLITSDPNMTINGSNCGECLCTMVTYSMSSLNCFANSSDGVICQLFSDGIYLGLNHSQMKINLNSIFYFRLTNQSEITTAQMITSKGTSVFEWVVSTSKIEHRRI